MQQQQPRPPYVVFERVPEEDRAESVKAGRYMSKDVDYAVITPQGSKDRIYRQADAYLAQLVRDVQEDRMPAEWLDQIRARYDAWKKQQELPEFGTPIKAWPVLSPAQQANLLALNVRTVEDLAAANEETLRLIGMGARSLKQKAEDYLLIAKNAGAPTEELNSLRVQIADLTALVTELQRANKELKAEQAAAPAAA